MRIVENKKQNGELFLFQYCLYKYNVNCFTIIEKKIKCFLPVLIINLINCSFYAVKIIFTIHEGKNN